MAWRNDDSEAKRGHPWGRERAPGTLELHGKAGPAIGAMPNTTRKITEFRALVGASMGPNQSLQVNSIEPSSHEHPSPNYIR
jgi:hypothetical protein